MHSLCPRQRPIPPGGLLPDAAVSVLFVLAVRHGMATPIDLVEDIVEHAGEARRGASVLIGRGLARWAPDGSSLVLTGLGISQSRLHCAELAVEDRLSDDERRIARAMA